METRQPGPQAAEYPHLNAVEGVLGIPLVPEGVDGAVLDGTIREYAYRATVRAVKRQFALDPHDDLVVPAGADLELLRSDEQLQRIAAQVQAANDTLQYWQNPPPLPQGTDAAGSAREKFQSRALSTIVEHSQRPPVGTTDARNAFGGGLLTVAPPGAGKTVLQALAMHHAGVGLPVSDAYPKRRTAVGILNSRVLIEQGLDPDETLQRYATIGGRDMRIGAYYTNRRDGHDEYDVLLTTPRSYEAAVTSGAINPRTIVRYVLDEAHRVAMAPRMVEHVTSFDSGLYMFTATPAIAGGRRDLRRSFPHSQFGSMREFIEDGILSPVQLFTYRAGPEQGSEARLAVSLAADYVRNGRKTLVVCQPGNQLQQAREIASELNGLYKAGHIVPHPKLNWSGDVLASAIGTFPGADVPARLKEFKEGKRLIATTVATGNEGLNIPDLDALVIIGPQGATWVVEQWLGRILRPSGQIAIASEILPANLQTGKPLASIFGPFGLHDEVITAGYYVGPPLQEADDPNVAGPRLSTPEYIQSLRDFDEESRTGDGAEGRPDPDGYIPLYRPPDTVVDSLVTGVSVREATVAPADLLKMPPAGYAPLNELAPNGVPVEWLHAMMDKLKDPNIRYVGVWEPDETGQMQYVRYYSPEAHAYFADHPVPELAGESEFLDEDIAHMLGVSRKQVRAILDAHGIEPLKRITKSHRNPKYYGMDTIALVTTEVAKTPQADETDVAIVDLGKEISNDFVNYYLARPNSDITAVYKRRHPTWGVIGTVLHITGAEADKLRRLYAELEVADTSEYIGFTEMAKLSGVSLSNTLNKWNALSENQVPPVRWLRSGPGRRPSMHVERQWGEAFIEYIKPEKVLPWEATLAMVALYFGKKKQNMFNIIGRAQDIKDTSQRVPLPGVSETTMYPMSIIPTLIEKGMEPAADVPRPDFSRLAYSPNDISRPSKLSESRNLQSLFIPHEQIARPGEVTYYAHRRVQPPTIPTFAPKESEPATPEAQTNEPVPQTPQETAPETNTNEVIYDLETARGRLDCTPHAFWYLQERIPFERDEVTTSASNEIDGFKESGIQKLIEASRHISMPPVGWTTLSMTAHAAGRATKDLVMEALSAIEQERGSTVRDDEVRLCRSGSQVEIYFSVEMRRTIRRYLTT